MLTSNLVDRDCVTIAVALNQITENEPSIYGVALVVLFCRHIGSLLYGLDTKILLVKYHPVASSIFADLGHT